MTKLRDKIMLITTNLERLDIITDDMIDTSGIPVLTEKFFKTAKWHTPRAKVKVTVEVEQEVLGWFQAQGDDYQDYLVAAIHIFAEAHQTAG